MQFAKDSFYVAMSERLAQLNPARTVAINGITRTAIVVSENELINAASSLENAFLIIWGAVQVCDGFDGARQPLLKLECSILYGTSGSRDDASDRGRTIAELDSELLQICSPPFAEKCDYTNSETIALNSRIFWTLPQIAPLVANSETNNARAMTKQNAPVFHAGKLTVFFYPEVA
jgi:hypothetical protein